MFFQTHIAEKGKRRVIVLLALPPLIFMVLFYFFPVIKIIDISFFQKGVFHADELAEIFATGYYLRILWFTIWQAGISTFLTLIIALPGAYVFARYRFRGKKIIRSIVSVPFVLPTVVVAAAFNALLGPKGIINIVLMSLTGGSHPIITIDQTIWIILLAHVFYNYTVVFRIVGGYWANIDNRTADAACMLGASKWKIFFNITLPLLRPSILAASLLVYLFCFCSFGVILILGGPRFSTIEVEIFKQAVHIFNLPMAAALSIIQIIFTFIIMLLYSRIQNNNIIKSSPVSSKVIQKRPEKFRDKIIISTVILSMLLLLGMPILALLARSFFTSDGFSIFYYKALFHNPSMSIFFIPPIKAVCFSLLFAVVTVIIASILGMLASMYLAHPGKGRISILDPIFMLPLSTSAVTLGFGFILALDKPPLNLRTSIMIIPIAHSLVAFPFIVRIILPALKSIPQSLRDAAVLLGASPWLVWKAVDLPIIRRSLIAGALFAFAVSLGEFGATAFIARPNLSTIPLAIYRFIGQPGALNYGQAMAMSSILMIITVAGFLLLERIRIKNLGEF